MKEILIEQATFDNPSVYLPLFIDESLGLLWTLLHNFSAISSCCLWFLPAFLKCYKQLTFLPLPSLETLSYLLSTSGSPHPAIWLKLQPCNKADELMLVMIATYLVCICNTILPGIKDDKFMWLSIGIHYCLQIFFIFFATLIIWANWWLAASCYCCLALRMNPG